MAEQGVLGHADDVPTWILHPCLPALCHTVDLLEGHRDPHQQVSLPALRHSVDLPECYRDPHQQVSLYAIRLLVERSSSVVECRTRNQECPASNPFFATVSQFGHFRSLRDAPVHSAV